MREKLSKYQLVDGQPGGLKEKWTVSRSDERLNLINWEDFKGMRVLDLGCNNGALCFKAKKAGAKKVIGVDKSDCILGARELAKERKMDIDFWQLDVDSIEFRNNFPKSDIVFLCALLTHIKDPIGLIKKVGLHVVKR